MSPGVFRLSCLSCQAGLFCCFYLFCFTFIVFVRVIAVGFYSAANWFSRMPRPSISTWMRSPGLTAPTPAGVPVGMRSPGSRVMVCGDVAEELGDGEDEVAGGALLLDGAVEAGGDGDGLAAGGVDLVGDDGADGAEGVEALAAGPLAVGLLDVAGGDVVDDDVAADVGADVFVGADVAAAAADDDA